MSVGRKWKQEKEGVRGQQDPRRIAVTALTFGSRQHGGGQLTLAGLQVAKDEPPGEAVTHDGVQWVGVRFSSGECCLQHRQPGAGEKKTLSELPLLPAAPMRISQGR
jgi:hypothetical protein